MRALRQLIAVVIQHWCLILTCWSQPDRSWTKAARVIQAQVPLVVSALDRPGALRSALRALMRLLADGATIPPRRHRPASFQLLANPASAGWIHADSSSLLSLA